MSTDPEQTIETEVHRCLMEALEIRDRGGEVDLEQICKGRREVIESVSSALLEVPAMQHLSGEYGTTDPWAGRRLDDRYQLVERLGAGAMGVVYRATDHDLGREVAVKLLRADLLHGPAARERFAREAGALAAVANPSVVSIFDRGETAEGVAYLVMEFVDGSPLSMILDRAADLAANRGGVERLDDTDWLAAFMPADVVPDANYLRVVVGWIADIADGLHAAHAAGILHRDVKPSNILIGRDGRALLADFGIAITLQSGTLTTQERGLGTPAYMAPEQMRANAGDRFSEQLDVYGLAAALYHCVTLRPPYDGTPSQVFSALERREPFEASRLRPGLPRDLQAILDLALRRKPEARYPSVAGLSADLRSFLAYRPVQARPTSRWVRVVRQRANEIKIGVGLLVAAILAVVSYQVWQERVTERLGRVDEHYGRLSPLRAISAFPKYRVIHDPESRRTVRVRLDELVALSDQAMPPRLMRAAFRLDHGDPVGAAADMAVLADELDTPYVCALAQRFADLEPTAKVASDVKIDGLPEPQTPAERRIAAFRRLRWDNDAKVIARCAKLLEDRTPPASFWGRSIELMVDLCAAMEIPHQDVRRVAAYREVYESARELQTGFGREAAATLYMQFVALTGQARDEEALALYESARDFFPDHFGLHLARGSSLRRRDRFEESIAAARAAMRLRPESPKPYINLVNVYLSMEGQHEAALATIAEASLRGPRWDQLGVKLRARAALDRAVDLWRDGDRDASRAAARESLPVLGLYGDVEIEQLFCEAILASGDNQQEAARGLLDWWAANPAAGVRIQDIALLLPSELEKATVVSLRRALRAVAKLQTEQVLK